MRPLTIPRTVAECTNILFEGDRPVSVSGRFLVLLSLAVAATVASLPDLSYVAYIASLIAASTFTVLGGMMSFWTNTVLLDFKHAVCIRRRGFLLFTKVESLSQDTIERIILRREDLDRFGSTDSSIYSLLIFFPGKEVVLFNRWSDERAIHLSNVISDRLELPLRVEEIQGNPGPNTTQGPAWLSGVMWIAMLSVAGVMLWPVISGSRPIIAQSTGGRRGLSFVSDSRFQTYQQGISEYYAGRFAEAEKSFRRAEKENPGSAEILNMLAYSLAEQGKMDDALDTANSALKLAPLSGNIIDTVAEMHERRNELSSAAELYSKALKYMKPSDSGETNTKFGRTLIALSRKD